MDAFKAISILFLFASSALSQETGVVSIITHKDSRSSLGCGVIVKIYKDIKCDAKGYEGWVLADILTADHVILPPKIEDSEPPPVILQSFILFSGDRKAVFTAKKRGDVVRMDIAFGTAWVPPESKEIPVADEYADGEVEVLGRAGVVNTSDPPRRLFGKRIGLGVEDGRQYFDIMVAPGDSGGPILFQGKVVGIVSGGITQQPWGESWSTWPLISARFEKIKEMIKR